MINLHYFCKNEDLLFVMFYLDATHDNISMFATDLSKEVGSKLLLWVTIYRCSDNQMHYSEHTIPNIHYLPAGIYLLKVNKKKTLEQGVKYVQS